MQSCYKEDYFMKMMEIRKMSKEEMEAKMKDLREELGNLVFQHKIRPLEDTSKLKKIRKDIARIETIASETTAA
ncbi:probable 50S ribosomal protein L29 [Desulfotalea psychrophila LSv54]|uniref:Large ribosomal subunit protein uL29 n=2 Tax=Desulfotalea psychrophila TaxID=84980 RepID=Q6AP63_DESPS|nr:probable 50S ribosomal protein L29 [Desulfotalea psychrophila LSv54]